MMNIKNVINRVHPELSEEKLREYAEKSKEFVDLFKKELSKERVKAEVFVGGSLAKKTMNEKKVQDIDIFVRILPEKKQISKIIESVERCLKSLARQKKYLLSKVHVSRDYFSMQNQAGYFFEIVPVKKIKIGRAHV